MTDVAIPCLRCRATAHVAPDAPGAACPSCGFGLPPPGVAAWMVAREGLPPNGPYRIVQLAQHVRQAQVLPTDRLWHEGAADWVAVGELSAFAVSDAAPAAAAAGDAAPAPTPSGPAPVHDALPMGYAAPPAGPHQPHVAVPYGAPGAAPTMPYGAPGAAPTMPYGAPGAAPTMPYGPPPANKFGLHIRRAIGWDVRSMPVEPDEHALLVANSVDEDDARRYLVWRRSVLLVVAPFTLLSALLALIGSLTNEWSGLTPLGVILELIRLAALFVLPLTAWLAAKTWDRHKRSRTILLRGWLVAFLTPLLLALFPYAWRVDMSGNSAELVTQATIALSLLGAVAVYITLMPAVLSLIPGVLRGCLRVKTLLPQSILPGWFLIAATPLYVLLFLVVFTTVNQLAGNLLLMVAVLALLAAPLLYLLNASSFTRPLHSQQEIARIGNIQKLATLIVAFGLVLLVIYAFTASVMGRHLIGFSETTSLIRPWNPQLIQFPIDYFVRSLFTTVLVADMFMIMNLSLWRHSKAFAQTPEAASYDRLMSEIEEAGERR